MGNCDGFIYILTKTKEKNSVRSGRREESSREHVKINVKEKEGCFLPSHQSFLMLPVFILIRVMFFIL